MGGWIAAQTARDFADKIGCRRRAGKSTNFNIAETMKRETRSIGLFTAPAQDITVTGIGIAQILGVNAAIRIEALSKSHAHARSGGAAYFQAGPANHVLAHVEDVGSVDRGD